MLTSRRDQENAIHAQQTAATAKSSGAKSVIPKTPSQQASKTPFRVKRSDENALSISRGAGKVKDAVAVLEGKAGRTSLNTPAARTRAPLGAKTTNVKATAFQTPARPLTIQRPVTQASSPRLRKAKFRVLEAKDDVATAQHEEREIEYMHPREVPMPDFPDDDLWPHDRVYPQFEGDRFTQGWALEFMNDKNDTSDFDTRMAQFEAREVAKSRPVNKVSSQTAVIKPGIVTATKAALATSRVQGVASFASATSSSAARSRLPTVVSKKINSKPTNPRNQRHAVAKAASNTTLGYAKGRNVSATHPALSEQPVDEFAPLTTAERNSVLHAMWRHEDVSDNDLDDFSAPMIDILALDDLRDFALPED